MEPSKTSRNTQRALMPVSGKNSYDLYSYCKLKTLNLLMFFNFKKMPLVALVFHCASYCSYCTKICLLHDFLELMRGGGGAISF